MDDSSKQVAKNSFGLPNRLTTVAVQLFAWSLGRSLPHVPAGLRARNRLTYKTVASPDLTDDATDWRQTAAERNGCELIRLPATLPAVLRKADISCAQLDFGRCNCERVAD